MAKKKKTKKILTLKNGSRYEVLKIDGLYFYCKGTQFLRNNPNVVSVGTEDNEQVH